MRTKTNGQGLKSHSTKNTMVFSAIDNRSTTRTFQSIQPDNKKTKKENRNSHAFITSPYDSQITTLTSYVQPFKHIPQTFTTDVTQEKVLQTNSHRPTMGGKTISAIQPPTTVMSCQELKLLDRRINPHEPLSSPHASPSKPPLPNSTSRKRARDSCVAQRTTFVCEPCNKKYKTRNGFNYHVLKCKYRVLEKTVIQCICQDLTNDITGSMIECIHCHTWLHLSCAGGVTNESSYCPRCRTVDIVAEQEDDDDDDDDHHLLQNGKTIKLSELCQAKERGKNLLQSFKQTITNQEKPIRNEFNFISLFSDHALLPELSPVLLQQPTDQVPSLLYEEDPFMDEFSSDLSMQQEEDWLHFANFEVDFHADN